MPRGARIVVPGIPHHVTQRGNRRERTFFRESDYKTYLRYMRLAKAKETVSVWAYCLMPNHVHFVCVPQDVSGLGDLFRQAHRQYTCHINKRKEWVGHLWQGRFYSAPMDESHLVAAVRYIERNPVDAGLCGSPEEWPWSSARAHLAGVDDVLVDVTPMLQIVDDWSAYLSEPSAQERIDTIRQETRRGKPIGSEEFVEKILGR